MPDQTSVKKSDEASAKNKATKNLHVFLAAFEKIPKIISELSSGFLL